MHVCLCVCRHVCMHDNRNMYILYACMHENKRSGNPTKTKLGSKSSTFFPSRWRSGCHDWDLIVCIKHVQHHARNCMGCVGSTPAGGYVRQSAAEILVAVHPKSSRRISGLLTQVLPDVHLGLKPPSAFILAPAF